MAIIGMSPMLIALAAALCFALLATLRLARSVRLGAAAMLVVYVASAVFVELPPIPLGLFIYPQDILVSLLAAAALLHLFNRRALGARRIFLGFVFGMVLLSMARGFALFGTKLAGNEARGEFWFLAPALYFATSRYDPFLQRKLMDYWMRAAVVLCLLVLFRWSATLLHLPIVSQWEGIIAGFPMRVVQSSHAFFLLIASLMAAGLTFSGEAKRWQRWLLYVSAPIVVLLQHRTVWICAGIALLLLLAFGGLARRKALSGMLAVVLVCGLLAAIFVSNRGAEAQRSYREAAQSSETLEWRVAGWTALWDTHFSNPVDVFVGEPYGSRFYREMEGGGVDVAPHNEYLQLALRIGIVGLGCFLMLYVTCLWRVQNIGGEAVKELYPGKNFWRTWLVMSFAYFMAYSPSYEQSILLGMIIGMLASRGSVLSPQAITTTRARGTALALGREFPA